jgi:hypothetical protein
VEGSLIGETLNLRKKAGALKSIDGCGRYREKEIVPRL